MTSIALWRIPAVRRKFLLEAAAFALVALPFVVNLHEGLRLFPTAYLVMLAVTFTFLTLQARLSLRLANLVAASRGSRIGSREQAALLWDAAAEGAERLGMPVPRVYVMHRFRGNYALSWGRGDYASIGVHGQICAQFTPPMLRATVAHELGHLRLHDMRNAMALHFLSLWVHLSSAALLLSGIGRVLTEPTLAGKMSGLTFAIVAGLASVWTIVVRAVIDPIHAYWIEYSADAVACETTGDAEAMIAVLLFAVLEKRDTRANARPRAGASPPPLVRIRKILDRHPDALRKNIDRP